MSNEQTRKALNYFLGHAADALALPELQERTLLEFPSRTNYNDYGCIISPRSTHDDKSIAAQFGPKAREIAYCLQVRGLAGRPFAYMPHSLSYDFKRTFNDLPAQGDASLLAFVRYALNDDNCNMLIQCPPSEVSEKYLKQLKQIPELSLVQLVQHDGGTYLNLTCHQYDILINLWQSPELGEQSFFDIAPPAPPPRRSMQSLLDFADGPKPPPMQRPATTVSEANNVVSLDAFRKTHQR